jgi:hypothetical protein
MVRRILIAMSPRTRASQHLCFCIDLSPGHDQPPHHLSVAAFSCNVQGSAALLRCRRGTGILVGGVSCHPRSISDDQHPATCGSIRWPERAAKKAVDMSGGVRTTAHTPATDRVLPLLQCSIAASCLERKEKPPCDARRAEVRAREVAPHQPSWGRGRESDSALSET